MQVLDFQADAGNRVCRLTYTIFCKLLKHSALYFTLITVASPAAQGLRPGTPLWGYPSHSASLVGPSRSRSHGRLRRPKSLCHPSSRQVHHSAARLLAIVCKQRGRTRALESSSREATQAAAMTAGRRRCVLRASPCPCHSGKGVPSCISTESAERP